MSHRTTAAVRDALAQLGIRRLLLGIHDAAFPGRPGEDAGRGSPNTEGGRDLLRFAAALGFDGFQLGPAGASPVDDPSPYVATLFSRSPLGIALAPLATEPWGALVRPETIAEALSTAGSGERADYPAASGRAQRVLDEAYATFVRKRAEGRPEVEALARKLVAFRQEHGEWLVRDALFEVLVEHHREGNFRRWSGPEGELDRALWAGIPGHGCAGGAPADGPAVRRLSALIAAHGERLERYAFVQLVAHLQHAETRRVARALGLALFADLQIGLSDRDTWSAQGFALHGFRMGAPPSRTNPEGQPWGYPVFDPACYRDPSGPGGEGAAMRFVRLRAKKAFAEYDGLRIDHPHGLVDPWVYRTAGDPGEAVRAGARLFSSPDVADLAPFAIARLDQLRPAQPRYADGWVADLDPTQVDRYGLLLDLVVEEAQRAGAAADAVACEILSTQPYPLQRVIERHGLGRFRVTQKADLARPEDGYRGENARPEDWIMLGNHDTPTIWERCAEWVADGRARDQAAYLATRLLPSAPAAERERWAARVAGDAAELAQARFADLFVGPARQVSVAFTDLFGFTERYNAPGTISRSNWSLRLPAAFADAYGERVSAGRALDLPRALAAALRARGVSGTSHARALAEVLGRHPAE